MAELGIAVDLRQHQSHAADDVRTVVTADPHGRARTELHHVDRGHFGIEVDVVVDGDTKHRSGLRRSWSAGNGVDLGDEAGGRGAQRDRRARLTARSAGRGKPGQLLVFGDDLALADEHVRDLRAFLIG